MKIVIVAGLSDDKLISKIKPFMVLEQVVEIHLIRRTPLVGEKIKAWVPPGWLSKILFLSELYRLFALIYLCWRIKPDLIIAYYFIPHGIYAALGGGIFKTPVIQISTGSDISYLKYSWVFRLISNANFIGVRGSMTKQMLLELGVPAYKLFVPPNVFDLDDFLPLRMQKEYDLVHVSHFTAVKRIDILIQVISQLVHRFPKIKVALIGPINATRHWQEQVKAMGLQNNVSFLGYKGREELCEFLNRSRVFIMTSEIEGLPMALVEAISCGLPSIVPDVGNITDIAVDQGNALIVPELDVDLFVEATAKLLIDAQLYEKLYAGAIDTRLTFSKIYSLDYAISVWLDVLDKVGVDPNKGSF
jgi:L-malate glycosyltransferase